MYEYHSNVCKNSVKKNESENDYGIGKWMKNLSI